MPIIKVNGVVHEIKERDKIPKIEFLNSNENKE